MRATKSSENNSNPVFSDVNRKKKKKKIMHQRAEFEPMQTARFAPWAVVPVLAEVFP